MAYPKLLLTALLLAVVFIGLIGFRQGWFSTASRPAPTTTPAPTGSAATPAIPSNWQLFIDPVIGYQISHPSGWYTHPASSPTGESSITSFSITGTPNTDPVPQDQIKVAVTKFDSSNNRYSTPDPTRVLSQRQITVAGRSATWRSVAGQLGNSIVVTFEDNGARYIISAFPAESQYLDRIPIMLDSFKLTDTAVRITNPQPQSQIQSPLQITGQAPGTWFFEGQMSARLEDASGNNLGTTSLTAQGEWMTENPVPFRGTLTFQKPSGSGTAFLIIESANPSGMPENQKSFRISLRY